jgi:hypothetical protein
MILSHLYLHTTLSSTDERSPEILKKQCSFENWAAQDIKVLSSFLSVRYELRLEKQQSIENVVQHSTTRWQQSERKD